VNVVPVAASSSQNGIVSSPNPVPAVNPARCWSVMMIMMLGRSV
jgi:hypothetical protein